MKDRCRKPLRLISNKTVRNAVIEAYIKHKGTPTMEEIIEAMEEYCGMNRIEYVVDDPFEYD